MQEGLIAFALALPRPWPPLSTVVLSSKKDNESEITISITPLGSFHLNIDQGGNRIAHEFQPFTFTGSGKAMVAFSWNRDRAELRINDTELKLLKESGYVCVPVRTYLVDEQSMQPEVAENLAAIETECPLERHFLGTVSDIAEKVARRTRYDLIRASGLLRQLLLDTHLLAHQVNHKFRIKLIFEALDFSRDESDLPDISWVNLDPSPLPKAARLKVSLDAFLKIKILRFHGFDYSVRDTIQACAHLMGGVHTGLPKDAKEQAILEFQEAIRVCGDEPCIRSLTGICKITLRALSPLVEAINRNQKNIK